MTGLYTEIINTTHALIVVFDTDGRIVLFNRACERVSGYRFEEVQGRQIWDFLLLPEEAAGVKAIFAELKAGHFPNVHKNYWITKSGERCFIEWSNSAVIDETGCVTHVIGTGIDVTEKRAAEHALRETQQRQRALLDSIPDVAWLMDADERYIEINRNYSRLWGIDASDIIGKQMRDFFPAQIAAENAAENCEVLRTGKPLHIEKHRVIRGREYWFDTTKVPSLDEAGNVTGIACISHDITERKLAEAQRMARDAGLRAALVKEVHHRIKNNLQGVITLIQQLTSPHPENASLVDAVITRLNAIASVHGLYGAIGKSDLRLEQVLLALVSSLKVLDVDLPVRLSVQSAPESVRVTESEIVPLALVVNELIMNAIKHSRSTTDSDPVEVVLESAGECARVIIRNHSGRLPAQFDFDTGAGLGTGLSLVRSLLPPAGAALRFENAAGPTGTQVELTLRPPVITLLPSSP